MVEDLERLVTGVCVGVIAGSDSSGDFGDCGETGVMGDNASETLLALAPVGVVVPGGTIARKMSFRRSTPTATSSTLKPNVMPFASMVAVFGKNFSVPSSAISPGKRRNVRLLSCPAKPQ